MADSLRIVQLNLACDPAFETPRDVLAAYHTLTGWSRAVTQAGAVVTTVQRYSADSKKMAGADRFVFISDGDAPTPEPWDKCERVTGAVVEERPDVVHVNGLMFPGAVESLRRALPSSTAIVMQDHSGTIPRQWPWPLTGVSVARWERAFAAVDAFTFTAAQLATRWRPVAIPPSARVIEISEAGSSVFPVPVAEARRATGIEAAPAVLWAGHLDANKDPLTALAGMELAFRRLPHARCWMVYGERPLERVVRERIAASQVLAGRVTLVGAVRHDRMAHYFSAADVFVSASHHEGSGYSLIEAMACGVSPCVTDIPSFRALTGDCGVRWTPGDPTECAAGVIDLAARDRAQESRLVRRRYDDALSWDAIGRKTIDEYRRLHQRRESNV